MQTVLDKSDLIRFESTLKNSLSQLFTFSTYSLYFPREIPEAMQNGSDTVPVIEKDRILLPLVMHGDVLGIFLAKGTKNQELKVLKPYLSTITGITLEKLVLRKQCVNDSLTGLYNNDYFCSLVEKEVQAVLASITPGPGASMDNGPDRHSASFCVMIFNIDYFRRINSTYGFAFGDKILQKLAKKISSLIPEQAISARLGNDTFAVFWPQTSQKKCIDLTDTIRCKVGELIFEYDVSGEKLNISLSAGSSFFPQDIRGAQFRKSPYELSRIIIHKATQAMEMAKENGRNRAYSFGKLLSNGGSVIENLPLDRLVVNLGRHVDAAEGQKFMVWSGKFNGHSKVQPESGKSSMGHYPPIHKGEITILEVQDRISIAELLYLNDPTWKIEPGDKLSLLQDKDSLLEKEGISGHDDPQKDILTGLYSYRNFISLWTRQRNDAEQFSMFMLKIQDMYNNEPENGIEGEKLIQTIVYSMKSIFSQDLLGGRYSATCLIFYLSRHTPDQAKDALTEFCTKMRDEHEITLQAGISFFPCLSYSKMDTLENCRKALAHAALTQFPHIAVFNSLTLTVSADQLFTQGDNFAAMEEYKLALNADESNILARNSLAICYARLGKMDLARKHFLEITALDDSNLMAIYNFACVCLKQMDIKEAQAAFEKCLLIDDEHAFSLFRLGQIAENSGQLDVADEFYNKARNTPEGEPLAPRHLARLAWKKEDKEKARELLHQALINNPRDAFSLNLMARIYLESGDDPQIAESLTRQSVVLRPDVSNFWLDLAETLKAQDKHDQAARAKARAYG
ncbi:GGDEF domain-containing protein [Desulfonatronovibrio magnus]|uniref:GGDEF domain-containing protein n=1 Tax=Desulfonatronovibrio magnus TaxID=698827 RepID=UPI000695D420|nr:GGDEF domain-containing protein [Desulfonatronovibrio magnus]